MIMASRFGGDDGVAVRPGANPKGEPLRTYGIYNREL